jgi:hypothetical protein
MEKLKVEMWGNLMAVQKVCVWVVQLGLKKELY